MSGAAPKNLLQIAMVLKSNGTDGELVFGFRGYGPEDINREEPVFLYFDGLPVPYFISSFSPKSAVKAFVRLHGINSGLDADEVIGKGVFVENLDADADEDDMSDIIGWTLMDEKGIAIGEISGYEDIPGNPCLDITTRRGEEIMIPLHEDLIISTDPESSILMMKLPEGLL